MGTSIRYTEMKGLQDGQGASLFHIDSEIIYAGRHMPISLLSLSPEGAQLQKHEDVEYSFLEGNAVILHMSLGDHKTEILSGTVSWDSEKDLFINFSQNMSFSPVSVQKFSLN